MNKEKNNKPNQLSLLITGVITALMMTLIGFVALPHLFPNLLQKEVDWGPPNIITMTPIPATPVPQSTHVPTSTHTPTAMPTAEPTQTPTLVPTVTPTLTATQEVNVVVVETLPTSEVLWGEGCATQDQKTAIEEAVEDYIAEYQLQEVIIKNDILLMTSEACGILVEGETFLDQISGEKFLLNLQIWLPLADLDILPQIPLGQGGFLFDCTYYPEKEVALLFYVYTDRNPQPNLVNCTEG